MPPKYQGFVILPGLPLILLAAIWISWYPNPTLAPASFLWKYAWQVSQPGKLGFQSLTSTHSNEQDILTCNLGFQNCLWKQGMKLRNWWTSFSSPFSKAQSDRLHGNRLHGRIWGLCLHLFQIAQVLECTLKSPSWLASIVSAPGKCTYPAWKSLLGINMSGSLLDIFSFLWNKNSKHLWK